MSEKSSDQRSRNSLSGCHVAVELQEAQYVASKAGKRLNPHNAEGYNLKNIESFIDRSLINLGIECIDLLDKSKNVSRRFQFHNRKLIYALKKISVPRNMTIFLLLSVALYFGLLLSIINHDTRSSYNFTNLAFSAFLTSSSLFSCLTSSLELVDLC